MAGFNDLPKIATVGAQWVDKGGHRCGRCANPYTATGGRDDCPNNRPSQTVPYAEDEQ